MVWGMGYEAPEFRDEIEGLVLIRRSSNLLCVSNTSKYW